MLSPPVLADINVGVMVDLFDVPRQQPSIYVSNLRSSCGFQDGTQEDTSLPCVYTRSHDESQKNEVDALCRSIFRDDDSILRVGEHAG